MVTTIPHIRGIFIVHDRTRSVPGAARDEQRPFHGESWGILAREFPDARVENDRTSPQAIDRASVELELEAWLDPRVEVYAHDALVRAPLMPFELSLVHRTPIDVPRAVVEVATRYQGLMQRRNAASAVDVFDGALRVHRSLHDLSKPLVEADYYHGLDTWQWVLRLDPDASLALQVAALFHDVERLSSEPERRIEQHALDYAGFKEAHARTGASIIARVLKSDLSLPVLERVTWLVSHHERASADPEITSLNDADALSFFSLNSAGFLDYYGSQHTRKKVDYTLGRLRRGERWRLDWMRLPPVVSSMVRSTLCRDIARDAFTEGRGDQ